MGKYNWNIDILIEKKKLIEKLLSLETNKDKLKLLQRDYYTLQNQIEEQDDYSIEEKMKLLESYDYIKDDLLYIEFIWNDFKTFNNIVNIPLNIPNLKRNNLSKDDILSITHDFYKSLNKDFFGNFMKNFRMRNDHIIFSRYTNSSICGETITLPSLKESYINILRNYNNDDILTTIHEYSHATSTSINPNHINNNKSLYVEIDSLFMELIASDYIAKLFKDNTNTISKVDKLNDYASIANDLIIMINTIDGEKYTENGYTSNKMLKNIALTHYNITPEMINDVIGEPNLTNTIYLTSYMFALELFYLYKEDKDKTLYTLKKIILLDNMKELEYYSNILKLGLTPNFSLQKHYKEMERDALKLTRKKNIDKMILKH